MATNDYAAETERRNALWRQSIDMVTSGQGLTPAALDAHPEPGMMFRALCYGLQYSPHDAKKPAGYISTTEARAAMHALGSDEITGTLFDFMEPHPCQPHGQAVHWPINAKQGTPGEAVAWGMIVAIERGWFAYDRAGFLQWSETGRAQCAAGPSAVFVQTSTGQGAFAF